MRPLLAVSGRRQLVKQWRAPRDPNVILLLVAALILLGLVLVGTIQLRSYLRGGIDNWPINLSVFALVLALVIGCLGAIFCLDRARRRAALTYTLDRNMITVFQPGSRYMIPLDQIVSVGPDERTDVASAVPEVNFGHGRPAQRLIVQTHQRRYRLVLLERDQFAHELQERRQLGIVQRQQEGRTRERPVLFAFVSSATVQRFVLATLLLNIAVWSLLTWRYPTLPDTVPIRFDPLGGTAGTRGRASTLVLPLVATAIGLLDTMLAALGYRRTRLGSELLLFGGLIIQIIALAAVWFIVSAAQ